MLKPRKESPHRALGRREWRWAYTQPSTATIFRADSRSKGLRAVGRLVVACKRDRDRVAVAAEMLGDQSAVLEAAQKPRLDSSQVDGIILAEVGVTGINRRPNLRDRRVGGPRGAQIGRYKSVD